MQSSSSSSALVSFRRQRQRILYSNCWLLLLLLLSSTILVLVLSSVPPTSSYVVVAFSRTSTTTTTARSSSFVAKKNTGRWQQQIRRGARQSFSSTTTEQRMAMMPNTGSISGSSSIMISGVASSTITTPNTLKPAMEHTQPLWGPPDPFLAAGKSIAPITTPTTILPPQQQVVVVSSSDLVGGGTSAATAAEITATTTTTSAAATDSLLSSSELPNNLLDATRMHAETVLPGFSPTIGGILPHHIAPPETPESFAKIVEWSASFYPVVEKLPQAALAYVLVEFFLLRPGIDQYKEDIDEERGRSVSEFLAVASVRVTMFCLVALVTTGIFGA